MGRCLPKYLVTNFLIIILGLGLLFLGLNQSGELPTNHPKPTPQVESTQKEASPSGILVTKVIDGDTIEIESGEKVRYIGVDTPETVDPRRPVGCFGKEASAKNKELVEGKRIILEEDVENKDKYKRLLRYVFLPLPNGQTLFVNDYLIREGFGKLLIIPPDVKYKEQFVEAQQEARKAHSGLWGRC